MKKTTAYISFKEEVAYESPNLETINICAERGFAASGNTEGVETPPAQNPW